MRRPFDTVLALIFAAFLLAPSVDTLLRPSAVADIQRELRSPSPPPHLPTSLATLRTFPAATDAYLSDHLGLRDHLLSHRSHLYIGLFRRSPTPAAVLGRSNWVFPTLMGILDASRGTTKLTPNRLALWQRTLESRREFCASHAADYFFALAPEKPTLYPDFLPAHLAPRPPTALDQFRSHFSEHSTFQPTDLLALMRDERARDTEVDFAYYPLGTHWTDRALHRAYTHLLDALSARHPGLTPTPVADLHWTVDPEDGDTWATNLRMESTLRQNARVFREIESDYDCELGRPHGDTTHVVTRGPDPTRPRLVLFHDSFGDRMRKLFARDFSECYFCWGGFDPAIVERERPDVVIELRAERQLLLDRPAPIAVEGRDPLAKEFERASRVLWSLDLNRDRIELVPVDGATLVRTENGLAARLADDSAGSFELAGLDFTPGRALLARVVLEASEPGILDVLYTTKRMPRYRRGQVATASMPAGRSTTYVEIDEPDLLGALRFRFGREVRTVVLRSIEVRERAE